MYNSSFEWNWNLPFTISMEQNNWYERNLNFNLKNFDIRNEVMNLNAKTEKKLRNKMSFPMLKSSNHNFHTTFVRWFQFDISMLLFKVDFFSMTKRKEKWTEKKRIKLLNRRDCWWQLKKECVEKRNDDLSSLRNHRLLNCLSLICHPNV